jgi:hypothetical protein
MNRRIPRIVAVIFVSALVGLSVVARAQQTPPTTAPATTEATLEPTEAVVVKVAGTVRAAPVVLPPDKPEWKPVHVGDRLGGGTVLRTGLRSSVLLQFGDTTIVKIDRVTSATIDQFYRTAQLQKVELDVGYGSVRAGVAEGALESDMTIQTPVATLTKRGTWNFGVEYEAVTGRFRFFVEDYGLVEALNQLTQKRQSIAAGQYVTQAMIRWIERASFARLVPILDIYGLTGTEVQFVEWQDSGQSVVDPGGGLAIYSASGLDRTALNNALIGQGVRPPTTLQTPTPTGGGGINRAEGNFGTGGISVPSGAAKDRR